VKLPGENIYLSGLANAYAAIIQFNPHQRAQEPHHCSNSNFQPSLISFFSEKQASTDVVDALNIPTKSI